MTSNWGGIWWSFFQKLGKSWNLSGLSGTMYEDLDIFRLFQIYCHPKRIRGIHNEYTTFSDTLSRRNYWLVDFLDHLLLCSGRVLVQCGTRRFTSTAAHAGGASQNARHAKGYLLFFWEKRLDVSQFLGFVSLFHGEKGLMFQFLVLFFFDS